MKKIIIAALALLLAVAGAPAIQAENNNQVNENNASSTPAENNGKKDDRAVQSDLKLISQIQQKSQNEIGRRVESLEKLSQRIQEMKRITQSGKNTLIAQLQTQIDALNDLKAKLAASGDASTAVEFEKKIANDFRIFSRIVPQGYLNAAIDRIDLMAQKLQGLSAKIAAKIAEAKAAGNDTAKLEESVADLNQKIAHAKTQADTAKNALASIVAGNDTAQNETNRKILLASRENIKTAEKDLKYCRAAANVIAKQLRQLGAQTNVGLGNAATTTQNSAPADATTTN